MTIEEFERARQKEPEITSGKANSFPVFKHNWATHENADTKSEDPLLINPRERDPSEHLEWVFDWNRTAYFWNADPITASLRSRSKDGTDDPYGKASIAIYGLNRAGLFRERMEHIKKMQVLLQTIVDVITDRADTASESPEWDKLSTRLAAYKKKFQATFTNPDKPYAGMAGAFLAQFDAELPRLRLTDR